MSCCGKKEHYGEVKLDWGVYPMGLQYDDGGCPSNCNAAPADGAAARRAAAAMRNIQQRGSNNAFQYEACPERLRYAIGTGCMNSMCKCPNCQGDCKCMKGMAVSMFRGHSWLFWLVVAVAIWFIYKRFIRR